MRSRTILLAASLLCVAALAPAQQPRKVQITDVKVGQGQPVKNGDLLLVEYTGTFKNGKQFDSNAKPDGTPFALRLGAGNVIRGWDEGLVGMRVGGVRKLMIPWEKAYGSTGTDRIPPKTDLYFTVKLLDAVRAGEERVYDKKDLKVGTGAVAKDGKPGSKVTIHYVGKLVNGRVFDDSHQRNVPAVFTIGKGEVLRALEKAIVGMRVGGKRWVRLPPQLAFGAYGRGSVVPPNSVVIYEVELLKVE
jgi:FKBP-type peptidyl-prolyl cis-trans isomerase